MKKKENIMKKESLNFINLGHALGRSEMKKLMAGSGGNIHCSIGGSQWQCGPTWNLTECTDHCVDLSSAWGVDCEGCAQFP